jgi:hypothetical protein
MKILRLTAAAVILLAVSYAHASAPNADSAPVRPTAVKKTVAQKRVVFLVRSWRCPCRRRVLRRSLRRRARTTRRSKHRS